MYCKQCNSVCFTDKVLSLGLYTVEDKNLIKSASVGPPRTDSMSSHDSIIRSERTSVGMISQLPRVQPYKVYTADVDWTDVEDSQPQKPKKQSSQIAKELSDMVIYVQVLYLTWLQIEHKQNLIRSSLENFLAFKNSVLWLNLHFRMGG